VERAQHLTWEGSAEQLRYAYGLADLGVLAAQLRYASGLVMSLPLER